MKATLILVGRTNNELFAQAIADYVGRIGHYIPFKSSVCECNRLITNRKQNI